MNKRQQKKRDKEAIKLAKKIMWLDIDKDHKIGMSSYWARLSKIKRKDMKWRPPRKLTEHDLKYGYRTYQDERRDFKYDLSQKKILLKVCRKCLEDGFPIEEYFYWEKPYGDIRGCIMVFTHIKDYENYRKKNKEDRRIRSIDFWCPRNAQKAIPQDIDCNKKDTCFEAIYYE